MKQVLCMLVLGLFVILSCKNESKASIAAENGPGALSAADIIALAEQADFVDFLFYHMNISVSQNEPSSVQTTTRFFTPESKPASMECPAIGRISFQSKGKIIKEADIHMNGSCSYFTLVEGKTTKGTNLMSPEGANFLKTLINSYQTK